MTEKIKELQTLCDLYHLNLKVIYYGSSTNFIGFNDDEEEVFNVCVWYRNDNEREFYVELNSQYEQWRGGSFTKENILLLLSIDDLSDEQLSITPKLKSEKVGNE